MLGRTVVAVATVGDLYVVSLVDESCCLSWCAGYATATAAATGRGG